MLIGAFAVNDESNGGDLTSGTAIGAKDDGFNGATTFTSGDGTPFAGGSFSITTLCDSKDQIWPVYVNYC